MSRLGLNRIVTSTGPLRRRWDIGEVCDINNGHPRTLASIGGGRGAVLQTLERALERLYLSQLLWMPNIVAEEEVVAVGAPGAASKAEDGLVALETAQRVTAAFGHRAGSVTKT